MGSIAELKADPKNARRHSRRNIDMLVGSLQEVGAARSIVIDEDDTILAGHGVVEAAGLAGIERLRVIEADGNEIIAVRRSGLTETEKRKLSLYDNRVGELADWDPEILAGLMAEDKGLLAGMFSADELSELLKNVGPDDGEPPGPQMDRAEELRERWGVERAQVWEIPSKTVEGKCHRVMCGDSTSTEDGRRLMGKAQPTLMVTDPPYGVNYNPEWRKDVGVSSGGRMGKVTSDDRAKWSAAYIRSGCDVAYVWHAAIYAMDVARGLQAAGFTLRAQIVWAKKRFALSRGNYHWAHELCWYAVRKGAPARFKGGRRQSTLWADIIDTWCGDDVLYAARVDESTIYTFPASCTTVWEIGGDKTVEGGHSTQKPLECMARPIRNHEGDVYDPFLGSGTTMIAAEQLGRLCYGMEIEPKYVAVSLQRVADMGLEPRLMQS